MTNHHKPTYGASDQDKSRQGGHNDQPRAEIDTTRAEKARIGGQHSNGGTRRRNG